MPRFELSGNAGRPCWDELRHNGQQVMQIGVKVKAIQLKNNIHRNYVSIAIVSTG